MTGFWISLLFAAFLAPFQSSIVSGNTNKRILPLKAHNGQFDLLLQTLNSSAVVTNNDGLISIIRHLLVRNGFTEKEAVQDNVKKISSKYSAFFYNERSQDTLLSKGCTKAMDNLVTDILRKQDYSKIERMLDADGKPGSGLFEGDFNWLGSYRECKETDYAHFCISEVNLLSYAQPVTLGLCVPKECTDEDVFTIIRTLANITNGVVRKPLLEVWNNNSFTKSYGSPVYCDDPQSYSTGNIVAFCVAGFFGLLVLIGTVLDALSKCTPDKIIVSKSNNFMPVKFSDEDAIQHMPVNENQPFLTHDDVQKSNRNVCRDVLLCFSFRKNASQIFDTNMPSSAISCLNGIRTLSMFWVILGHTFFFALYAPSDNPVEGFQFIRRFSFQAIANAYFSVDTFFLLSGLLVSYLTLKRFDRYNGESFFGYFWKKFLPQFYLHRFLRLTPVYMFVILFYVYIFPFCGDGPLWFQKAKGVGIENCKNYWWTNLLYINNFYPTNMYNECIGWSWYLANDMQFYIISPLIVIVMHSLRLPGTLILSSLICIASFSATGFIIGVNRLNALLTGDFQEAGGDQAQDFADLIYSKPYSRIPPYIVGLSLGYFLYNKKHPKGALKTLVGFIGWTLATAIALAATYGPYTSFRDGGRPFTLVENVLYGTFSRFSWALCVAWVVFACHFEIGGFINSLLSWKAFTPLSRLTYTAYLVHPVVIQVFYSSFETPLHFTDITVAFYFTSFIMMTYASAFLLAVCIEFPLSNLEKLLFRF